MKNSQKTRAQLLDDLALFQRFAEAATQGFGIADLDGRVVYVNPALCRLLGEETPGDAVGKHISTYYPPDYQRAIDDEVAPALEREEFYTAEQDIVSRQGKVLQTLHNAFLIRNEKGEPYLRGAAILDITDRKRAEQALHESEARYRTLVETLPDAVILADLEGRIAFASQRAAELYGCPTIDELIGRNPLELVAPEDHPLLLADLLRVPDEAAPRKVEYTYIRKDRTRFVGEVSGTVVRDAAGTPTALLALIRDITERKRTERTLAHFSAIVSSSRDAITGGNLDGIITVWNAGAERLYGYTAEEAIGQSVALLLPPDRAAETAALLEKIRQGEGVDSRDTVRRRKDGTLVDVSLTLSPIRDAAGQIVGGAAIVRDITERKRAEEALRQERRTLEHLLRSSDHERQLIAYEIHDGLAQQLAGAIMQFDTYCHQKNAMPKEAARAYDAAMTMLHQAHFEARRLISGVRPPILDESGVVAAVAHLVNEQQLHPGPTIEFHSEVEFNRLAPILENAIYRIVQEGLANACKHSNSPRVRVELVQHGEALRIKMRDWGKGFDPTQVADDRFGLAGIRERARLLGGKAVVESGPEIGTCIMVELPLVLKEGNPYIQA